MEFYVVTLWFGPGVNGTSNLKALKAYFNWFNLIHKPENQNLFFTVIPSKLKK